jgi:adenylate cyclase
MNQESFKRKLTAVLSADVEGYSRLMAEDETATVKTLETYREVMSTLIMQHRGRVIDSPGDNLLAEFTSVVDAVQCAVAVQKEFQARNTGLPENRRMEFRIGVNLGDVIEEGERIYGDGVNIAARLEALAEPGGICVSKTAFDHIESKLPLGYHYLGEQEVKNIPKPVGAYRVLMEPRVTTEGEEEEKPSLFRGRRAILVGVMAAVVVIIALSVWRFYLTPQQPTVEPASVEKMAYTLPSKRSIAVMPFDNMSGDPDQEYFSDGLTEEIITTLSKISDLFVIARQSTFSYKGKPVKIKQVAEELGVQYVLEGSVRKDENRIRITAQLIDALTGHHLWAETYERELKGIFAVQDEIKKKIITALQVKLTEGEQARIFGKGTDNVEAWALGVRAWKLATKYSKENQAKARELLERALEVDPGYPLLWHALAHTHFLDARLGWTKSPPDSLKLAFEYTKKALTLDPNYPFAHMVLGNIYIFQRQYEKAIAQGQRAIFLDPNYADGYAGLSQIMRYSGRFEEALTLIKQAMRLSPNPRVFYPMMLGAAHLALGRHEEAIAVHKELLRSRRGEFPPSFAHVNLIVSYIELGRDGEARAEAEELLRIAPTSSLEGTRKRRPYKDPAHLERYLSALRKAGIPEKPPLPLPDKPSIAVLPFVNMSDDPKQEYFSDGITESIITALSNDPDLFVIARNSTFSYKGKSVKTQKVSKELGVRYVLEGSVQKSSDRVRITAQLVDAMTGHHLWAEQYDRDLKDLFALQDEIVLKILTALQVKLTAGEQARVRGEATNNLKAYLKYMKGRDYFLRFNRDDNVMARRLFKEVIVIDSDYSNAYSFLGWTHILDIWYGSSKSPGKSLEKAAQLAQKALALDDSDQNSIVLLGYLHLLKRQHDKAIVQYERATDLNPNAPTPLVHLGMALNFAGRPDDAIVSIKKAIRLNPIPPSFYLHNLANAYRMVGQYEDAIAAAKKALDRTPDNLWANVFLAATYSQAGRLDEARAQAVEVLRVQPKFSTESFGKKMPFKYKADADRFINALRKSGLK